MQPSTFDDCTTTGCSRSTTGGPAERPVGELDRATQVAWRRPFGARSEVIVAERPIRHRVRIDGLRAENTSRLASGRELRYKATGFGMIAQE